MGRVTFPNGTRSHEEYPAGWAIAVGPPTPEVAVPYYRALAADLEAKGGEAPADLTRALADRIESGRYSRAWFVFGSYSDHAEAVRVVGLVGSGYNDAGRAVTVLPVDE